jgi:hypothetical protein
MTRRGPAAPRPAKWADIVVGCLTTQEARRFRAWLTDTGVDCRVEPESRNVYVPWMGDPRFLIELFEWAVKRGHAADDVAARAMGMRLAEIERRSK